MHCLDGIMVQYTGYIKNNGLGTASVETGDPALNMVS
jgi:hypothetical protein